MKKPLLRSGAIRPMAWENYGGLLDPAYGIKWKELEKKRKKKKRRQKSHESNKKTKSRSNAWVF